MCASPCTLEEFSPCRNEGPKPFQLQVTIFAEVISHRKALDDISYDPQLNSILKVQSYY